jgi:hypothetical protein
VRDQAGYRSQQTRPAGPRDQWGCGFMSNTAQRERAGGHRVITPPTICWCIANKSMGLVLWLQSGCRNTVAWVCGKGGVSYLGLANKLLVARVVGPQQAENRQAPRVVVDSDPRVASSVGAIAQLPLLKLGRTPPNREYVKPQLPTVSNVRRGGGKCRMRQPPHTYTGLFTCETSKDPSFIRCMTPFCTV